MGRKYPSLILLSAVIACILIADSIRLVDWVWLLAGAVTCGVALYLWLHRRSTGAVLCFALALGFLTAFGFTISTTTPSVWNLNNLVAPGDACTFYGRVVDWPHLREDRTDLLVEIDSINNGGIYQVRGNLLLRLTTESTKLQRNDRIAFRARYYDIGPENTPGNFSYSRYLRLKGIQGIAYLSTDLTITVNRRASVSILGAIDSFRDLIRESLQGNLTPGAAALALGFLIGETHDIAPRIYQLFRDTGTLHVLAVSGANVALVVGFLLLLLRPLRPSRAVISVALIVGVLLFSGLSYLEPSVVRATVMAILVILARWAHRAVDLNQIIATTALFILLVEPTQLFDIGFQLSFVTAWGLIFFTPLVNDRFGKHFDRWWYRWLVLPAVVSFIAQVCSTPLIALHFGRVPILSLFANLLVVPLTSIGVVAVLVLLVVDLISPLLAYFFGSIVSILLELNVDVLEWFGSTHALIFDTSNLAHQPFADLFVVLFYGLLVLGGLAVSFRMARRLLVFTSLATINLALLLAIAWPAQSDNRLVCFRIPGGVASVIVTDNRADLVLSDVESKEYPIDERILTPALTGEKIDRLHRLFVMNCGYGVIDDLLRLAERFAIDTVWIAPSLQASFAEHYPDSILTTPVVPLSNSATPRSPDSIGISYSGASLNISTDRFRIFITDDVSIIPAHQPYSARDTAGTDVLLLTRTASTEVAAHLHRRPWDWIVCATIAQPSDESHRDFHLHPDAAKPDDIVDLKAVGVCRIPLTP